MVGALTDPRGTRVAMGEDVPDDRYVILRDGREIAFGKLKHGIPDVPPGHVLVVSPGNYRALERDLLRLPHPLTA